MGLQAYNKEKIIVVGQRGKRFSWTFSRLGATGLPMDWTPTCKLRFVTRGEDPHASPILFGGKRTVRVLQQWWEVVNVMNPEGIDRGQWRDVPLEME